MYMDPTELARLVPLLLLFVPEWSASSRISITREVLEAKLRRDGAPTHSVLIAADLAQWLACGGKCPEYVEAWPKRVAVGMSLEVLPCAEYLAPTSAGWSDPITFKQTKSSFVTWAQWHAERMLLRVCLKGHGERSKEMQVREYGSVTRATLEALETSKSPGSCYNDRIRDRLPVKVLYRNDASDAS